MKKNDVSRIVFCALFLAFLIPVAGAVQQYSCFDFDPVLYGKSVQTAISRDGSFIATGSPESGTISMFSPNGTPVWNYRTGDNITSVALSDDGSFVTAATYHGNLYYFDTSGNLLWNITGRGCNPAVKLSGDGLKGFVFARGTKDPQGSSTVHYFDFNGTVLWEKSVPFMSVADIPPDAKTAFLGTMGHYGNDVIMISDDGSEEWRQKMAEGWKISGVAISNDGTTVAASTDTRITVFSKGGAVIGNISPKYLIRSLGISPDGMLVAAGTQYRLTGFNRSGMALWDYPFDDYVDHVEFTPDGQDLVAVSGDTLYYFTRNGTCTGKYALDSKPGSISVSHNGEIVVAGMYDNSFAIIDRFGNVRKIDLRSVSATNTTPVYPGMGGAPKEVLTNMYPTVKDNPCIMGFIRECGVGSWHEEQMDAEYKSAHLAPADSCGKQLVFSIRKSAGRGDPLQITSVWIIGINETWSRSMEPACVYPTIGDAGAPLPPGGTGDVTNIFAAGIVIALAITGVGYIAIRRGKGQS